METMGYQETGEDKTRSAQKRPQLWTKHLRAYLVTSPRPLAKAPLQRKNLFRYDRVKQRQSNTLCTLAVPLKQRESKLVL